MQRIDWDKINRQRNVWKPDHRANFERNWQPDACTIATRSAGAIESSEHTRSTPQQFSKVNPGTAKAIKERLRTLGFSGTGLTRKTNEILRNECHIAWVEFDVEMEKMRGAGFLPCPIEIKDGIATLRFILKSKAGESEEERVFTFNRHA